MPELPEVETVKRICLPSLERRRITRVQMDCPEVVSHPTASEFLVAVQDERIRSLERRGKYLLLHTENAGRLVLHLRMTGWILVAPKEYWKEKHTCLTLCLDNDWELRFVDIRRFGRVWWLAKGEVDSCAGLERLGPEYFDPELTAEYL